MSQGPMHEHDPGVHDRRGMLDRRGMQVRREVLGGEHVDAAVARTTAFSAPFQELVARVAWGETWTREGLDRRTRSCITLAILTALRCEEELALHVRAALRNGLSAEEIREVLLHSAVYAGVPAANTAFRVAQRVLAEAGVPSAVPGTWDPPGNSDPTGGG